MRWNRRDREMATRHMSPAAKAGIFIFALVAAAILVAVGWSMVKPLLGSSGLPGEVVAGDSFEPGAVVEIYGAETEAVLDGVTQKVQATDPTDEWKEALQDVSCDDSNVCTALAPSSAAGEDGEGGGFLDSIMTPVGGSLSGLLGAGLIGYMIYAIINEE